MLKNIGIIGEGKMGTNLFYYLLDMNFNLTWICSPEADLEKLRKNFSKRQGRSLEAGIIDEKRYHSILECVKISNYATDLASCEMIIEAISEELEAKQQLFRMLDKIAPPGCIFTSNSSSINPSALIPSENRKDKFVGLHFFYPIALKDIVEVIMTHETSKETLKQITFFLKSIRRRFLLLEEKDSFILNRIFLHFQNEAFILVNEKKASLQQIDRIVRDHFFPTGVFEFFDSVGLDVMLASVKNYSKDDPEEERYHPLIGKLQELVSKGKLGTKTKGGFYGEGISPDPGYPENDAEIIAKLQSSYEYAFRRFCLSSGIPAAELKTDMDEYFGVETPVVV
ncbi:MAG: 3-hydroxyacyl-CoA dehydrogenase family protein [Bacteroidetes bacterium]|nr:MAG: 3-hydroxyacyl-CoA dehydrogenase family protein [Bacteroidota bacterium]